MTTTSVESDGTPKRTRLVVDISPELRRRIRMAAAKNDLSVKAYIEEILEQAVPPQETSQATNTEPERREAARTEIPQVVRDLMEFQARLQREHPDALADYEGSVEAVRRSRQARDEELEQR